ncbi:MAG: RusA family crossover junction endodeoxyribonuclease [Clostridia bacterium]|nr:RusA family crossover junction endodeoxyribonuclease [Clostridia bacterium]
MNEIYFIVYGEPQGKGRPRFSRTPYGVRTYTPKETELSEARIGYVFKEEGDDFFAEAGEPVEIEIVAYHKIPASASNKKKNEMVSQLIRPTKKPDWDNIGKIVTDALNGIAWHDDAQIVDARVTKRYTADKPRVEITIRKGEDVA